MIKKIMEIVKRLFVSLFCRTDVYILTYRSKREYPILRKVKSQEFDPNLFRQELQNVEEEKMIIRIPQEKIFNEHQNIHTSAQEEKVIVHSYLEQQKIPNCEACKSIHRTLVWETLEKTLNEVRSQKLNIIGVDGSEDTCHIITVEKIKEVEKFKEVIKNVPHDVIRYIDRFYWQLPKPSHQKAKTEIKEQIMDFTESAGPDGCKRRDILEYVRHQNCLGNQKMKGYFSTGFTYGGWLTKASKDEPRFLVKNYLGNYVVCKQIYN